MKGHFTRELIDVLKRGIPAEPGGGSVFDGWRPLAGKSSIGPDHEVGGKNVGFTGTNSRAQKNQSTT